MNRSRKLGDQLMRYDSHHETESVATDNADNPHVYSNVWEYIMSAVGLCVGFGSFWRFPSLVFKNGGGVFLIPYFCAILLLGMPLLYLQTCVGQMHRVSIPQVFKRIHPSLKALGIALMSTPIIFSAVYNVLLTYCFRFFFVSFQYPLPFATQTILQNKYFHDEILHQTPSLGDFGGINYALLIFFILSLIVCHYIIKDGAKSSGKIILVTASSPFFIFILLILRGLFLEGAWEGIKYLFTPNWNSLWTPSIWVDATTQVFYQMSVGMGTIINLSTQKARREDIVKTILIVPAGIILCGLLSALTIFIYLSHFCLESGYRIGDPRLSIEGFQLSFNVLPKALLLLPFSNFWILIFFAAMVLLGIDSEFGTIEAIYVCIRDEWKKGPKQLFGFQITEKKARYLLISFLSLWGIPLSSYAGIYYLSYFDYYMSNIPFALWAALELYFFVYVFKLDELLGMVVRYTKQQAPWIFKYCLKSYWLPTLLLINLFFATIDQLLSLRRYSFGFYLIGWSFILIPLIYAYKEIKLKWQGWQSLNLTFKAIQVNQQL